MFFTQTLLLFDDQYRVAKKGKHNSESLQIEKRKEKINNGSNEVGEIGIDRSNEKQNLAEVKNGMNLKPPFHIVQLGEPRTGSTFQFVLLSAIAHLKSPSQTKINVSFYAKYNFNNGLLKEIKEGQSFVIKAHYGDMSLLKKQQENGYISIFASSSKFSFAILQQDREQLVKCSLCEIERYKDIFYLTPNDIINLTEHMKYYEIIRKCCGLQMSKYEVLRLNGCDMRQHILKPDYPKCEEYNIADVEMKFQASSIPYSVTSSEMNWAKPGDCARFNKIVESGKGFNGSELKKCELTGRFAGNIVRQIKKS